MINIVSFCFDIELIYAQYLFMWVLKEMSQQRYLSIHHLIITIIPNISKLKICYEDKNANAYDTLFSKIVDSVKHFRAFYQSLYPLLFIRNANDFSQHFNVELILSKIQFTHRPGMIKIRWINKREINFIVKRIVISAQSAKKTRLEDKWSIRFNAKWTEIVGATS